MGRSCRAKVSFAAGAGVEAGECLNSASSRAGAVTRFLLLGPKWCTVKRAVNPAL